MSKRLLSPEILAERKSVNEVLIGKRAARHTDRRQQVRWQELCSEDPFDDLGEDPNCFVPSSDE